MANKAIVTRLVATSPNGVKVSVALDVASATELVKAGFPARFTAWGSAADLTVGKAFEAFAVIGINPEREGKDKDGNVISYSAETSLHLG